jgi:hypothetical protein
MSATSDFYLTRADECARNADGAILDNVRERFQRAEAAWRAMAERLISIETMRINKRDAAATLAISEAI